MGKGRNVCVDGPSEQKAGARHRLQSGANACHFLFLSFHPEPYLNPYSY
jgi:hypothetical protein